MGEKIRNHMGSIQKKIRKEMKSSGMITCSTCSQILVFTEELSLICHKIKTQPPKCAKVLGINDKCNHVN